MEQADFGAPAPDSPSCWVGPAARYRLHLRATTAIRLPA
jgi:hypothetical protein